MKLEIAQSPCIPRFSILIDGVWDTECASGSEQVTLAAAKAKYPDCPVVMWDSPDHYSNAERGEG